MKTWPLRRASMLRSAAWIFKSRLARGSILSEHLSVANSPLLFGCRTGICGSCLIEVEEQENGEIACPSADEKELLELIAPDNPRARLACQMALSADIRIRYIGS